MSASDWLKNCFIQSEAIRSATQILVVTRHQYGVSALVSQTSFREESSGGFAKCRLFSQGTIIPSRSNSGQMNIFSGHCLRRFKNYQHGKREMQTICFFLSSLFTSGWEKTASLNFRIFKQILYAGTCVFFLLYFRIGLRLKLHT